MMMALPFLWMMLGSEKKFSEGFMLCQCLKAQVHKSISLWSRNFGQSLFYLLDDILPC